MTAYVAAHTVLGIRPREGQMAICNINEVPTKSAEQFAQMEAHLRSTGPVPPAGARLVLTGRASTGYRVIVVWDSPEARDAFFAERLAAAYESARLSLEDVERTEFEVDMLVAGDLTGTPGGTAVAEGR
jgi:hypothetical protein